MSTLTNLISHCSRFKIKQVLKINKICMDYFFKRDLFAYDMIVFVEVSKKTKEKNPRTNN